MTSSLTRCFAAPLLQDLPISDPLEQAGDQKFNELSLTPTFYNECIYGSAKKTACHEVIVSGLHHDNANPGQGAD